MFIMFTYQIIESLHTSSRCSVYHDVHVVPLHRLEAKSGLGAKAIGQLLRALLKSLPTNR